jgi:hypothetical protein
MKNFELFYARILSREVEQNVGVLRRGGSHTEQYWGREI